MRVRTHVLVERQAHACTDIRECEHVCVLWACLSLRPHGTAQRTQSFWLLQQVASTLALERPVLAADDEEEEGVDDSQGGDDSQIIDLDGINGKKLAVSVRSRTHNLWPSDPRLLLLALPVMAVHGLARVHAYPEAHRQKKDKLSQACST